MRLIGSLNSSEQASLFQRYCKSQGIDIFTESVPSSKVVQIWAIHEDDSQRASDLLEEFSKDPSLPEYYVADQQPEQPSDNEYEVVQDPKLLQRSKWPYFTWLWIIVTCICFLIQMVQLSTLIQQRGVIAADYMMPAINQSFYYDIPQGFEKLAAFIETQNIKTQEQLKTLNPELFKQWTNLEKTAYFHGFLDMLEDPSYKKSFFETKPPLFEKIRQGQLYRTITPVFLHGSILHILFNMLWLYLLLRQVEFKLGIIKTSFLLTALSVIPNTAQYLVSGPFFLGASGIVVGLAGFIWARQKTAPWEGYVLAKAVIFFLMVYVLALVVLSLGIFVFNVISIEDVSFGIANTAHFVGGITGYLLGRQKIFKRI